MKKALLAFVVVLVFAASALTALAAEPQEEIALPNGHMPEGIEVAGHTFYAGSRRDGSVYAGDVRTGEGSTLVPGVSGRVATGLKFDHGRLWVSGAGTGNAYVYDAKTGDELASYAFATAPTFINDVVVTRDAAWFTDSQKPVLYRVSLGPGGEPGAFTTVPLTGDYVHQPGFNVNGIDARPNGKTLVIVQSATGKLFTVTTDGVTDEIELADGANCRERRRHPPRRPDPVGRPEPAEPCRDVQAVGTVRQRPVVEAHHPPALRHPDDGRGAGQVPVPRERPLLDAADAGYALLDHASREVVTACLHSGGRASTPGCAPASGA